MELDQDALVALGEALRDEGYAFVTPTPETHRRVNARAATDAARGLRDVFGWSRRFDPAILPPRISELALRAKVLVDDGTLKRSTVRFSTLGAHLFVHSAYPTIGADAVFFGPDTYRYCRFLRANLKGGARRVVDIGCGSGAGGIAIADLAERIVLGDINASALGMASVNARLAGVAARTEVVESDVLRGVKGPIDVAIANPPYLVDPNHRAYRDGGGRFGEALAVRMAGEAAERLAPGGRLLLYTGAAVVDGVDTFLEAVRPICDKAKSWTYEELDPDVFGEEIELNDRYAEADRIAAVGLVAVF
jgi:methylase of polypeptide subunit release factors